MKKYDVVIRMLRVSQTSPDPARRACCAYLVNKYLAEENRTVEEIWNGIVAEQNFQRVKMGLRARALIESAGGSVVKVQAHDNGGD